MSAKRCAVCKKKITPEDNSTTLRAKGREVATCCSGQCFSELCELGPKMVAEQRKKEKREA